ncbi:hypothetical protein V8E53_010439 [Lactarius tabidus]
MFSSYLILFLDRALHRVWSCVLHSSVQRLTRPQLWLLGYRVLRSTLYVSPLMATVPIYKSSYPTAIPKDNQMILVKLFLDAILEMELGEVRQ